MKMQKVTLWVVLPNTTPGFVVEGEILPMNARPDVIYWGQRVFVYWKDAWDEQNHCEVWQYKEAFAVAMTGGPPK